MVINPNSPPNDPPCSTIVYRAILRNTWFDPDDATKMKGEAFMRRPPKLLGNGETDPKDSNGLSVFDSYRIGQQACIESFNSCEGIATLHVGTSARSWTDRDQGPRHNLKKYLLQTHRGKTQTMLNKKNSQMTWQTAHESRNDASRGRK